MRERGRLSRRAPRHPRRMVSRWVVAIGERQELITQVGLAGEAPAVQQPAGEDRKEQLDPARHAKVTDAGASLNYTTRASGGRGM